MTHGLDDANDLTIDGTEIVGSRFASRKLTDPEEFLVHQE